MQVTREPLRAWKHAGDGGTEGCQAVTLGFYSLSYKDMDYGRPRHIYSDGLLYSTITTKWV